MWQLHDTTFVTSSSQRNVACHTIKFAHVNAPTCHPPHSSLKVPKLYIQPQSTKAAAEERWLSVNLAFFCCQPLTENPNMSPSLPESQQLDAVSSSPPYSTPTANLFFAWSIALLKRMDTT